MKLGKYLLALAVLLIMTGLALAQGPLPEVDAGAASKGLIAGISTVNWVLICSGAGLLIIMGLRYLLLPKLKGKPLAIASCVLIAIGASAATLLIAPDDWMGAISAGLLAGIAAGNAWDLIPDKWTKAFNKLVKAKADKKAAKKANGG